jgi:hypothetical protein
MHRPLCLLLLACSPAIASAEPSPYKLFAVEVSGGAPQGFALAAALRPLPWLRAHAGVAHNILGPGIQGGVTLLPWRGSVTPTLTLEAGRFFETDVSDDFSGTLPDAFDPSLRNFGYDFYAALVGVELGSQRGVVFFLRGGLAWARSGLDGVDGYRDASAPNTTVDSSDVKLRAALPTVSLGLVWYVW